MLFVTTGANTTLSQDAFERSKHLLCHPWEVWEGMTETVARERAKGFVGRPLAEDVQRFVKQGMAQEATKRRAAEAARL